MTYSPQNNSNALTLYSNELAVFDQVAGEWRKAPINDEAAALLVQASPAGVTQVARAEYESLSEKTEAHIYLITQ